MASGGDELPEVFFYIFLCVGFCDGVSCERLWGFVMGFPVGFCVTIFIEL